MIDNEKNLISKMKACCEVHGFEFYYSYEPIEDVLVIKIKDTKNSCFYQRNLRLLDIILCDDINSLVLEIINDALEQFNIAKN